jgi:hypothetical protein
MRLLDKERGRQDVLNIPNVPFTKPMETGDEISGQEEAPYRRGLRPTD